MNRNKNFQRVFVIFVIILVVSSIAGCINQVDKENDSSPARNSLIIGITSPIFGFYPWIEGYEVTTMMINMNIFNSLVEFDQILRTKPKLATSWNNPNNLTWRFYLRENVKFHNGYNFTSEDVKYTIDLIKGNESHVLRDLLVSVKEVKIISDYTVDIITEKPCPILLNKLIDIPIASKRYVEETTEKWPIGTGAYKLVKYEPYEYVKLERNDEYWEDLEVKNVTFRIIEDNEEMKNSTISGEIDIASHILPRYYDEVSNCSGVRVGRSNQPTVYFLSFDFRENDSVAFKGEKNPLSDVRVRKAIYHAINITDIIDNIFIGSNFAEPASQFVSPMIFGYNPNIERFTWVMVRLFSNIFPNMIAKSFYPQFSKNPVHKLDWDDTNELITSLKIYRSKNGFINDIDQKINNEIIAKIKCPTLIIHSENDNSVSLEHGKYANMMIENSKIEILQNEWGHLFWIGTDSKNSIEKTLKFTEE